MDGGTHAKGPVPVDSRFRGNDEKLCAGFVQRSRLRERALLRPPLSSGYIAPEKRESAHGISN